MPRYPTRRLRGGDAKVSIDPATALHDAAVKLFDKGDGHGADWAAAAEALFRCAFAFLHNVPPEAPAAMQIARRVLDVSTSLVAGSEDSGAPYRGPGRTPHRPAFTTSNPAPDHDLSR